MSLQSKKGISFLSMIIALVLALAVGIVLIMLSGQFGDVGAKIYYADCEGNVEGDRTNQTGGEYILSERCTSFQDEEACEETYTSMFNNRTFCVWLGGLTEVDIDNDGEFDIEGCLMNTDIFCEDLDEDSNPKCSNIPRCHPINIIKKAIESLT